MEESVYQGVFSERDYSRNVILRNRSSHSTTVSEVMTRDLPVVNLTDSVAHCINTMNLNKSRYLLAFDANKDFAGVVTIHDLLRQVRPGQTAPVAQEPQNPGRIEGETSGLS
jgi:CBS domain-containing protein